MAECSTRALPRCAGRCPCEERGGQGGEVAGRFSEYFQQSQAPCSCNQSSRPVCGTDGQTYRSPCRAKCSTGGKFRRKCWGPCPCKTDKTKPKCGEPCGPTSACPGECPFCNRPWNLLFKTQAGARCS